ncbi:hypothetical protein F4809DRAFT_117569 [Biscogniauxia mediterranea]|nr:hypothetical protein F4809DRAFT_117569 [Biscogniauxia mediterranea]
MARAIESSSFPRCRMHSSTRDQSHDSDFERTLLDKNGKLWSPDDHIPKVEQLKEPGVLNAKSPKHPGQLLKQPETRPISQEQLVAEVKGIYAGLVMVESRGIEIDNARSSQSNAKLDKGHSIEQWEALVALHRTLLHELHDFFLACQHPSAMFMPALHRLASKYSMMAPLYETVPAFEDAWIECLGDLGRYRMAVRGREIWASVSRQWQSRAEDKAPYTGRLSHHLELLTRPNPPQQLYHYAKSLLPRSEPQIGVEDGCTDLSWGSHMRPYFEISIPGKLMSRNSPSNDHGSLWRGSSHECKRRYRERPTGRVPCTTLDSSLIFQTHGGKWPWGLTKVLSYAAWAMALGTLPPVYASSSGTDVDTSESNGSHTVEPEWWRSALMWHPLLAALTLSTFGAVYLLGEPLFFYGLAMGLYAGGFLLMAFVGQLPFDTLFHVWTMCAIYTIMWSYHDTLSLTPVRREINVLSTIFMGLALDILISSMFVTSSSTDFGGQDGLSGPVMMAAFLLPCVSFSTFLCGRIRNALCIITESWFSINTDRGHSYVALGP